MMELLNNKYPFNEENIVEVKYSNSSYTDIEVLYVLDVLDGLIHPYHGSKSDEQFTTHLTDSGWSDDSIMEATYIYLKEAGIHAGVTPVDNLVDFMIAENDEELFKFKLTVFDNTNITLNKDSNKAIRKAKSILECCSILYNA